MSSVIENLSLAFLTRSDTNWAVQPQMARGLLFQIYEVEGVYYVVKMKALISRVVTGQLLCIFVFAYAKIRFPHDTAHVSKGRTCIVFPQVKLVITDSNGSLNFFNILCFLYYLFIYIGCRQH